MSIILESFWYWGFFSFLYAGKNMDFNCHIIQYIQFKVDISTTHCFLKLEHVEYFIY